MGGGRRSVLKFVFKYVQGGNKTAKKRCEEVTKNLHAFFYLSIIENAHFLFCVVDCYSGMVA